MMTQLQGISSSFPYLLLFALGLTVGVSLAVVVLMALMRSRGTSRSSRLTPRPVSRRAISDRYRGLGPTDLGFETISERSEMKDGRSETTDERWMKLVEECVEVVDELDEHMGDFDAPRREVARHVILRMEEILGRSGVEVISNDATFDRARHKPSSASSAPGAAIEETLSPGFAVGRRVLRRARVRVG